MDKKRIVLGVALALCVALIGMFALIPISGIKTKNPDLWMKRLNDNAKITQLSIPGTHDAGATHSLFDVAGKCQDITIEEQLAIGVRFFDLRLKMEKDRFVIVHSFVDQNLTFDKVLGWLIAFIRNNPSEFLIISIKEDADSVNSTKGFEELLTEYFNPYKEYFSFSNALPITVGEARGKIHLISRYSNNTIGVPAHNFWADDTTFESGGFYIQDNYCVDSGEEKINDIKSAMEYAKNNKDNLVLNFTSCYLDGAFPPTYAGTVAVEINGWLNKYLVENSGCLGVMVCDFVTAELSQKIYGRNF